MEATICAKVDSRLLTKASRLFTGSMEGRIIEILQNARRAGATEVAITNKKGLVTVLDNGSGIDNFQKLLDLGGSGWDEQTEQGEDPAGVGLFSLAPRKVTILSKTHRIVIENDGWTGAPVEVTESEEFVRGTKLIFQDDEKWEHKTVEKHAVFCRMQVTVDGKRCHCLPFCSQNAKDKPELGCRIEVVSDVSQYHKQWMSYYYRSKVLVNFHGQVVEMDYWPGRHERGLHILVDLNQQTSIRLMLPARTQLVEDDALKKLKAAIEIEYYRYFQRQKEHSLYYEDYLRARKLGIVLPEAKPAYSVGLLRDEYDQSVQVPVPEGFELSDGYVCFVKDLDDETGEVNAHVLAALGTFQSKAFVPVRILSGYQGYSWAKLPKVISVTMSKGKERIRRSVVSYDLVCVESLSIEVKTSDGNTFASDVPMAVAVEPPAGEYRWHNEAVYVTEAARKELTDDNLWFHLGGFNPEGDSYDTQLDYISRDLDEFWSQLIGPYEQLRHELLSHINREHRLYDKWQKVEMTRNGTVVIHFKDGTTETVKPPTQD